MQMYMDCFRLYDMRVLTFSKKDCQNKGSLKLYEQNCVRKQSYPIVAKVVRKLLRQNEYTSQFN